MGEEPAEIDCTLFGMLSFLLVTMQGTRYESFTKRKSCLSKQVVWICVQVVGIVQILEHVVQIHVQIVPIHVRVVQIHVRVVRIHVQVVRSMYRSDQSIYRSSWFVYFYIFRDRVSLHLYIPPIYTPLMVSVPENHANLVTYFQRMKSSYWPDWDTLITASESFQNDQGKLYFAENVVEHWCPSFWNENCLLFDFTVSISYKPVKRF